MTESIDYIDELAKQYESIQITFNEMDLDRINYLRSIVLVKQPQIYISPNVDIISYEPW
jgi:hypothetical protein